MSHYRPYMFQYPAGDSMPYVAPAPQPLYPMPPSAGPSPLTSLSHPSSFTSSAYPSTFSAFSAPRTVRQQAISDPAFAYNNAATQQLFSTGMQPVQSRPRYITSKYPSVTVQRGPQDNVMLAYLVDCAIPASSSVTCSGYPLGYGSTPAANHGRNEALDTPDSPDSRISASPASSPNVSPPPPYYAHASMSDTSTSDGSPDEDHDLQPAIQSAVASIQRPRRHYTKRGTTVMSGGVTKPKPTTEQKTCPVCNQTFKGNLSRHMAKHSKELQVSCDGCGGRFARPDSLKRHLIRGSCKGIDDMSFVPCEKENGWVVEQPDVPRAPRTKRKTTSPSIMAQPPVSHSSPAQSTMSPPTDIDAAGATAVLSDDNFSQEQLEAFIRAVNEMSGGVQSMSHLPLSEDGVEIQAP
ncbi:hypothetical protein BV22DRAFT_1133452 [Leucogyrophana mollusca]|uniref:Uncharacterized protein n=1 Tax=Leucogyrophana mollusca TaxID=85980 RepID=A0ACB8B2R1_9AGAM|nr:hypothetical protein BV22DRAFT_1133452 [Leucogyrophana mollusca]